MQAQAAVETCIRIFQKFFCHFRCKNSMQAQAAVETTNWRPASFTTQSAVKTQCKPKRLLRPFPEPEQPRPPGECKNSMQAQAAVETVPERFSNFGKSLCKNSMQAQAAVETFFRARYSSRQPPQVKTQCKPKRLLRPPGGRTETIPPPPCKNSMQAQAAVETFPPLGNCSGSPVW